jgi:hypothetical protein
VPFVERMSPRRAATRERQLARLRVLKRRVLTASVLGFGALVGLSARHTLGTTHRAVRVPVPPSVTGRPAAKPTFFDEHDAGAYAFHDEAQASAPPAPDSSAAPLEPPPVIESSVS